MRRTAKYDEALQLLASRVSGSSSGLCFALARCGTRPAPSHEQSGYDDGHYDRNSGRLAACDDVPHDLPPISMRERWLPLWCVPRGIRRRLQMMLRCPLVRPEHCDDGRNDGDAAEQSRGV